MSTEQPVDPTQSAQPRPFVSGEANPIVDSILARTRWAERALSPWTQRWLSQPAATAFGRRTLPTALTVGAAQQTSTRVQAQYKSHSSRPVSEEANTLPLVGTLPQPLPSAEAAPSEASGPYSRPFNSLEDFLTAIEANKDRAETAPPPVASPKPAARRTHGPYSKAFNSLEEFMKAAEAARARDYAPPPPEEVVSPPPQTQPETPRYVHAFNSFEEFAKAAEESRQQWGYAATQEPKPEPVAPPAGKIRPMSRVEELPARGGSTLADVPPAMLTLTPQVEPESAESFSTPDQAPITIAPIEALSSQFDSASLAAPTPARPAVIPAFSPAKARGGKQLQASGPQPVQRKAGVGAESSTTDESPVAPSNEVVSLAPESFVEPAVSFVQQQAAESASVPAAYEMASPEVRTTSWPSAESVTTQANVPSQRLTGESIPAAVPTRAPISTAPTAQVTASQGRPAAISSAPAIQRVVEESAQDEIEAIGAEPTIQRQADEAPAMAPAAMTALEEEALPTATSESTPARLNMPLAQRKVAQAQSTLATSSTLQRHADEASSLAPAAAIEEESLSTTTSESVPVQRKMTQTQLAPTTASMARPTVATSPTVQRQADEAPSLVPVDAVDEEILPTTSSESMSVQSDMPPVQRKVDQAQSAPATASVGQRHADAAPLTAPEEEILPATPSASMPAQADMPLVQRKAAQAKPAPATLPVVQRHADAAPLTAPAAASTMEEESLPTSTSESMPARSVQSVPPAQRKVDPAQPTPATPPVVQRDESPLAAPSAAAALEEETLPAVTSESTPAQADLPLVQRKVAPVQRHTEEAQLAAPDEDLPSAAASESASVRSAQNVPPVQRSTAAAETDVPPQWAEESTSAREALPSAKMMPPARSDMPLVQRHVTDSQPLEEVSIQRRVNEPAASIGATPAPALVDVNISDRILARVTGHDQLPAAKLPALPLHQPVIQRMSAPEAQPALQPNTSEFVPATIQRMPEPVIQRTPVEPSTVGPSSGLIQRVDTAPAEPASTEAPAPLDLDNLARQVYPIIKHMLAVERERRSSR